jgi:hypothetical protein
MRKFGLAFGHIPVELIDGVWMNKLEHIFTSEVVSERGEAVSMHHYIQNLNKVNN